VTQGVGPAVLLLHGFPDAPFSFRRQIEALSGAGYKVIAPFLRGYEPGSRPKNKDLRIEAIIRDVEAWLDQLEIETVHLIGHDWGAVIGYGCAQIIPERLRSLTTMAVGPSRRFVGAALTKVPRQFLFSWYIQLFQIPGLSDFLTRRRDFALIKYLWRKWSPDYELSEEEWGQLRSVFERPGVLSAILGYYRQNANPLILSRLKRSIIMSGAPIAVPTLILNGARDGCMHPRLLDHIIVDSQFPKGVTLRTLKQAGHFLHLEQPETVNQILLDWLQENS